MRATSRTIPPASAIFIAADLPIPEEAPVTITTLPRDRLLERGVALQPHAEAQHLVGDLLLEDLREAADQAGAAAGRADQRAVAVEVGVEVARPVVPELAGVGLAAAAP